MTSPHDDVCPNCNGSGQSRPLEYTTPPVEIECDNCNGTGRVSSPRDDEVEAVMKVMHQRHYLRGGHRWDNPFHREEAESAIAALDAHRAEKGVVPPYMEPVYLVKDGPTAKRKIIDLDAETHYRFKKENTDDAS